MKPPSVQDFEKLGVFYLGRPYDLDKKTSKEGLILYDSRDLVTHAVCVGMTGSGKTGLCIGILEEAAIDGIPSIVIDPKGDLSNLLLTFPDLQGSDFRPWINEEDAQRKGLTPEAYAQQQASGWKDGLAAWGQDGARIKKLREAAEFSIYTPGSTAGLPVSILGSLAAPPPAILGDGELLQEQISAAANGLLGLLKIDADPLHGREQILLSAIMGEAWRQGIDLDLAMLVEEIQSPPMARIGVLELESFYPAKERFTLAMAVNNLLAAPGFDAWLRGDPLDIGRILHTAGGKPRVSIFSIAHLGDAERMFFVSFLLNRTLGWMRTQSGTTSLRALLYMDEIFGYFPPVANPPSKTPLLTLLKQGRAFGLGVVLATQNPVDLDYKGLSNAGTWFIGRLQTDRDKQRVLDGLEGAVAGSGSQFDRKKIDTLLGRLGSRVFLMNNVHDDAPEVFETRWTLAYLRGPLARDQIKRLMEPGKASDGSGRRAGQQCASAGGVEPARTPGVDPVSGREGDPSTNVLRADAGAGSTGSDTDGPVSGVNAQRIPDRGNLGTTAARSGPGNSRPVLPPEVPQFFAPVPARKTGGGGPVVCLPALFGSAQVRFVDKKLGVDETRDVIVVTPLTDQPVPVNWEDAREAEFSETDLERSPGEGAVFAALHPLAVKPASYAAWSKDFGAWLQRAQSLDVLRSPSSRETSRPGELERDFRIRLQQKNREQRDEATARMTKKYAPKLAALQERIRRAEQSVAREAGQSKQQQLQTVISVGATLLGSLFGRRSIGVGTIGRATTAARGVSRSMKEAGDVGRAQESVETLNAQLADLETELRSETEALEARMDAAAEIFEKISVQPARKDIIVRLVALVWTA